MRNSLMQHYIQEQPEILASLLKNAHIPYSCMADLPHVQRILITASGTSFNAAKVIAALFHDTPIEIDIVSPFQLQYYSNKLHHCDILLAISHTGKSSGTLQCARQAQAMNIPTIAFCADLTSPLAKACAYVIDIACGEEGIGPKTKGYTSTCLCLHLFLMQLLKQQQMPFAQATMLEELQTAITALPKLIDMSTQYAMQHKEWANAPCVSVIGYGINFGTACEGNLKLLETMQIPAMCYELEEFMHGAHRTIHEHSYLIFLHTQGPGYELMEHLITFAQAYTSHILVLSDKDEAEHCIPIPCCPLTNAYLDTAVVLQVLAAIFPEFKGIDPSAPVHPSFATHVGTRVK